MNTRERCEDVEQAVEEDFTLHYRVTETSQFLDRLLPVKKETVDRIFQDMRNKGLYDSRTHRWSIFPPPPDQDAKPKESELYGPFIKFANVIHHASNAASEMGATTWVDYHSRSPKSSDSRAAQLRPDGVFALQFVADQTSPAGSQEADKSKDSNGRKELKEPKESQESKESKDSKESESMKKTRLMIWWLQIIAVVEMKRSDSQQWIDVVKQLLGYLRRILREQLDRRFVFGLTMGPEKMTVWLYDRSGVIGTKMPIDIHKEPKKFIQVIAAFSVLSPEKLGFDPTIKLLVSPNHSVPSYTPNTDFLEAYKAAPHDRRWVIKMNDGREYVTVHTVSSVQAGFMRGRGTIAWVVVPFNQAKANEEFKLHVLKQSWCPRDVDSEGKLYDEANGSECDWVGRIELCEEVLISGKADTTDGLIRQGLDDSTGPGKRTTFQRQETSDPYLYVACTDVGDIQEIAARDTGSPVSRVRLRVVLSTYGWLIKYFSTRRELLHALRDAIAGHKYLYMKGVLHRDISPGNILIKWHPGSTADQPSTSGCLIDLDRGKKGKLIREEAKVSVDNEMIEAVQAMIRINAHIKVQEEVARLALEFPCLDSINNITAIRRAHGHALDAIQHALDFRGLTQGELCTPQHLQWRPAEILYNFHFDPTERQKGSRTGTPPYTSGEVLSNQWYFTPHKGAPSREAAHDIESFFWVLVHICITRQGPGGIRRVELEERNRDNEQYSALRRVVCCFFDSKTESMALNKQHLFRNPCYLEQFVLDNFGDYFQPLKGLVKEWFYLLQLAHGFHSFEYYNIHDLVLDILDRGLESFPTGDIDEAGQKVLDDRKANIEKLRGNPFGKVQQSPPPHTSPTSQQRVTSSISCPPNSPTPITNKRQKTTLKRMDDE